MTSHRRLRAFGARMTPPPPQAPRTVLDLLAEKEERATPGPWSAWWAEGEGWFLGTPRLLVAGSEGVRQADADLIALLRNHAAELIAGNRMLEVIANGGYGDASVKAKMALRPLLAGAPEGEA